MASLKGRRKIKQKVQQTLPIEPTKIEIDSE